MADAPVRGIVRARLPYTGITAVDAGFTIIAQQVSQVATEIDTLSDTIADGGTPSAPTSTPVPTGLTVATNSDGSMDVTLTWDYTDGTVPADFIVLFWKQGGAALAAPTAADKALLLAPTARAFTFQGWNPNSNYRFGIGAGAKTATGSALMVGAISSPTAAPDWADVSATGNYTAAISGTPAVTVTANAANGQTAFTGTTNYRTAGAPSTAAVPAGLTTGTDSDGSARYTLTWNYTQGARIADGFFCFVKEGDTGTFALTDPHFELGAQPSGSFSVAMTVKGYPSDRAISCGVAAFRRTEVGLDIGGITTSAGSPDWQGITTGSPNYAGTIFGVEPHNFEVFSAGSAATDQTVKVTRDGVDLWNPGSLPRSYTVVVYDTGTKTVVLAQTCDVFFSQAEWMNVGLLVEQYMTAATRVLILIGSDEPQSNRLVASLYARVVSTGTSLGAFQSCAVTPGQSYMFSCWVYCTRFVSGYLHVGFNNPGAGFDRSTTVQTTLGQWVRVFIGGVIPAGVTSVQPYFLTDGGPNGDWNVDDVRLELGATIGAGANLVTNPGFQTGDLSGWSGFGTPGAGESRTVENAGLYTLARLEQHGLERASFTSTAFRFRSAFILVGQYQCGPGNGLQVYAGLVDTATDAMCRLSFQTQGQRVLNLSGVGWSPDRTPGAPTNSPVPAAVASFAKDNGSQLDVLGWTYTQPDMVWPNKLADGFIIYGRGANGVVDLSTAAFAEKVDVNARQYTREVPLGQTWSYAIAAYRKTASGPEAGGLVNSSVAPDWQGVVCTQQVTNTGLETDAVSTGKVQNNAITDPKISSLNAAKITTGLLTVNPTSGGATAIFVDNAGKLRLKAMSSTPSTISFEDASGIEKAALYGSPAGALTIVGNAMAIGTGSNNVNISTAGITVGGPQGVTLTGPASTSLVLNSSGLTFTHAASGVAMQGPYYVDIPAPVALGAQVGYLTVYQRSNGAGPFKIPVYA